MSCTANISIPFIKLHVHPQLFSKKQTCALIYWSMQVHLHADLVYLLILITGIPIHSTNSLVNKLGTPIYTEICHQDLQIMET